MDNVKKEAEKTWEGGNNYIIFDDNASTKEELDKNWAEFAGNMTVKHQLRADEESIRLYGKTNQERYNEKLKKISKTDTAVKEYGVIIEPDDSMDNIEKAEKIHKKFDEETLKKIEDTKEYMDAMNTVLMYPTETLAELEELWERIQSEVPVEKMILNNTFSMQTWGMTSEELYNSEKASFLDMAEDIEQDLNDWDIAKKIMDINDIELSEDSDVEGMVESLYMLSSVEPSSFFEKVNVAMEKEKIAKSLHNIIEYCPMAGMNPVVGMAGRPLPALLPDEVEREGINTDSSLNKYKVVPTNTKKAKKYKDYFDYLYRGVMPEDFEEVYEEWKADVYTEQSIYNRTHSDLSKQNLFALGWPYSIPFENEALCHEFTMQRISEYYQYAGSKVINLTEFTKMNSDVVKPNVDDSPKKENMNPIYLLLISGTKESLTSSAIRWWTKGPFCHAAIGFRHTLDDLKSFNTTKYNGLSDESLDFYTPDERIAVYGLFVDDPTMEALRANLDFYIDNRDKTKYSRLNILSLAANIPLNFQFDMVCSQFVDRILKFAKIDITHKDSSLVSPNDFYTSAKNNKKMYKLYDGKIKDYKPNKVKATVQRLLSSKKTKRINEALMLDNISEASATYDPPYNRQQILDIYGKETLDRLMEDPAHRFRADTGIELMHIEPSKKEFIRIWKNWNLMTAEQKKISDKECKKLYGKTNLKFYYDNLPLYRKDGTYHEFPTFFESSLKDHRDHILYQQEDDIMINEAQEYTSSKELYDRIRKFEYGILVDGKAVKITAKNTNDYRTISPLNFEKYKVGLCWDFAEYEYIQLSKMKLNPAVWYIEAVAKDDKHPTHTWCSYTENGKTKIIEAAWGKAMGIHEFANETEMLNSYINKWLETVNFEAEPIYSVHKINKVGVYGLTYAEYMNRARQKPKVQSKGNLLEEVAVLNEDGLSTRERNELPASAFGIPSMRKYPLTDASHVKSAIKLFGHCPKAHEKELASNIKSAMRKYDIPFDSVGKDNKLYKYIHEAYDQILDSISAELVVETKEFPVQFNKDGDLIIKNYRKLDYNAEYQTAHSALLTYKKAKNYEGMKYELSKLWFINTILLSKAHDPKTTEEERIEINKIRAWVMNDINTYLKIINKVEPKFNFSEYYNESPFSDVAIKINRSTIKAFGDIIKHVIH